LSSAVRTSARSASVGSSASKTLARLPTTHEAAVGMILSSAVRT
jgi:hypothetical protein